MKHLRLLLVDETGQVLSSLGEFFSEKSLIKWLRVNSAVTMEEEEDEEPTEPSTTES